MIKATVVGNPTNAERQRIDVVETIVMLRVMDGDDDVFVRVNDMQLRAGKARNMHGAELVPWTEEQALPLEPVSGEMSKFDAMTEDELEEYGAMMADGMVDDAFDINLGEAIDGPYDAELRETALGGPDEDPDA